MNRVSFKDWLECTEEELAAFEVWVRGNKDKNDMLTRGEWMDVFNWFVENHL